MNKSTHALAVDSVWLASTNAVVVIEWCGRRCHSVLAHADREALLDVRQYISHVRLVWKNTYTYTLVNDVNRFCNCNTPIRLHFKRFSKFFFCTKIDICTRIYFKAHAVTPNRSLWTSQATSGYSATAASSADNIPLHTSMPVNTALTMLLQLLNWTCLVYEKDKWHAWANRFNRDMTSLQDGEHIFLSRWGNRIDLLSWRKAGQVLEFFAVKKLRWRTGVGRLEIEHRQTRFELLESSARENQRHKIRSSTQLRGNARTLRS